MNVRDSMTPSAPSVTGGAQSSSMFGAGNSMEEVLSGTGQENLEKSFKEFCERPENKPLMEKHQAKEMTKAAKASHMAKAAEFQDKVISADYDAQKNIAPFLKNRVLKRIIQTFTNDPRNDFGKWARNPRVIEMLTQAKEMMDGGYVTEEEVESTMVKHFEDPNNPAYHEFKLKTRQIVRLPTEQLVGALNEHLSERRSGNERYKAGRHKEALEHYERAMGIVEFVVGLSGADQEEVDDNRVACLLNISAVHMEQKDFGQASEAAGKAVEIDPKCVKALLRRAKAYVARGDNDKAAEDLARVKELEPWNWDAEMELGKMREAKRQDEAKQKELFKGMLGGTKAKAKSSRSPPK